MSRPIQYTLAWAVGAKGRQKKRNKNNADNNFFISYYCIVLKKRPTGPKGLFLDRSFGQRNKTGESLPKGENYGEGGIRTLDTLRYASFQD